MRRILAVSAMVAAFSVSAWAEGKEPWASFGVGSWVKIKITNSTEVAGTKSESIVEQTTKILAIHENEVEVEVESITSSVVNGQEFKTPPQKTTQKYPRRGEHPAKATNEGPKPDAEGDEEITVAGNQVKCHWVQVSQEQAGSKSTSKVWTCESIPGFMARTETETSGGMALKSVTEVVGYEVK